MRRYIGKGAPPRELPTSEAVIAFVKMTPGAGITGLLCCSSDIFLQVLEGGRLAVNRLYHRFAVDPRHHELMLLRYDEIDERSFAGWAMGQIDLARLNTALLLKYSEAPALDPYAVSGKVSMALFNELVATASVMCLP